MLRNQSGFQVTRKEGSKGLCIASTPCISDTMDNLIKASTHDDVCKVGPQPTLKPLKAMARLLFVQSKICHQICAPVSS